MMRVSPGAIKLILAMCSFNINFQRVFTSLGARGIDACLVGVTTKIDEAMNEGLTREFTPDEVDKALSQMHPLKALGLDGFGVSFFQQH